MSTMPRVVIPLRSFDAGKSRLSGVLDVAKRQALIEAMLADVLHALDGAGLSDVVIAACGAHAAQLAAKFGIPHLTDLQDTGGLNAALTRACDATTGKADQVMIVAADLPRVHADDFVAVCATDTPVVVCPTHDDGTAVLRLPLPRTFAFAYGHHSALRHNEAAGSVGFDVTVLRRVGFTLDLDTPDDLAGLVSDMAQLNELGPHTRRLLVSQDVRGAATL